MLSSVFKTKKLVFVRKGTLFMTAETEAIKVQILSTGNAEILLEENDFLIVKWIKPEIKYSMAAYQYGKTGMANNYPWECSLTEEQIAFFLEHINAAVEYFKSKHHYFHLEVKEVSYENIVSIDEHGIKFSDLHWLTYKECAGCDCDIYVYKNICTGAMQIVAAVCIYFCSTGRIFTDVPYCGSIRLAG